MNGYSFFAPTKVLFGAGKLSELGAQKLPGTKALIVTTGGNSVKRFGYLKRVEAELDRVGVAHELFDRIEPNPLRETVNAGGWMARTHGCDFVLALGGGSVMDGSKGICAVAANPHADTEGNECPGDIWDFVNGGTALGLPIPNDPLPLVCVTTTAGTGSEATPNSIVAVPEEQLKVGIVNPEMIADAVILDGNMIRRLPRKIAASTGIDALCHAIECYTSAKANPFSDLFAMQALRLIFRNLEKACDDPDALDAKEKMMQAAFYAGVAITCSGTTAVHALSYPLGGRYHIPHGVANAIMLMPVMQFNKSCCIERFAEVYEAVGGTGARNSAEKADWVIAKMDAMVQHLDIPTSLKPYGVTEADLPALVKAGMDVQRLLVNNPRTVTAADAEALYRAIL